MRLFARVLSILVVATLLVALPSAARESRMAPNACIPHDKCCRVCTTGKACGNSCIQASKACHKGRGCACNEEEICPE